MQPQPATTASAVVDIARPQVDRESERHTQGFCRGLLNGSDASGSKVAGRLLCHSPPHPQGAHLQPDQPRRGYWIAVADWCSMASSRSG